ncbi:MAG: hypothetical protein DWQ10_11520 [Calditrichaeota bacterium]|nr:MAG: hypothetical protein DWQ10_11520 [Calditrichota bacterium]
MRLPNYYCYEQARLDTIIPNFMPFAQPDIVAILLNLPLEQRTNSAFFRSFIREAEPKLSQFKLVKGDATYPFPFGTIPAKIWTGLKNKLNMTFHDTMQIDFLLKLREFVSDLAHSQSVTENANYKKNAVQECVADFYRGNYKRASELDWWLAFEFWWQGQKLKD